MPPIELPHALDIKSLTEVLIRHFDLHEGKYQLNVGFRIGVGGFAMDGGPDSTPLPGAAVGVEGVTLTKFDNDADAPNLVDASVVNPAPKGRAKARPKKES